MLVPQFASVMVVASLWTSVPGAWRLLVPPHLLKRVWCCELKCSGSPEAPDQDGGDLYHPRLLHPTWRPAGEAETACSPIPGMKRTSLAL